jgi:hypothetical protein
MNKVMSPAAFDAQDAAAFSVRGYSMGAIRDGWWAFISRRRRKPNDDLVDELCIARTSAGRTLLRFLAERSEARHLGFGFCNRRPAP